MKALVLGFHMLYRLSQDSKYLRSGPAVEIPRRPVTDWWTGSNFWAALYTRDGYSQHTCTPLDRPSSPLGALQATAPPCNARRRVPIEHGWWPGARGTRGAWSGSAPTQHSRRLADLVVRWASGAPGGVGAGFCLSVPAGSRTWGPVSVGPGVRAGL